MKTRVAINGFGRIGRIIFRLIEDDNDFEIVAINDLTDVDTLVHLLKYDTNLPNFKTESLSKDEDSIVVDGKKIKVFAEKDPSLLPWNDLEVDVVYECTGIFTSEEKASAHINAGAKHVIISAPAKGDLKTVVYNVNHEILNGSEKIISAASCTTNCLAPVLKVLNDSFKVEKGCMTTVHAYTNDQVMLDSPHRKGINSRRGRAAAMNIIPTSTGAAAAVGKVIPELNGKLDGMAMRVPVSIGSVVDLTVELGKNTTKEEINKAFEDAKNETISITYDPIVSSDIKGSNYGSLVDGLSTKVLEVEGKQIVKIISWYDNEMSYSVQMVRTAKYLNELLQK